MSARPADGKLTVWLLATAVVTACAGQAAPSRTAYPSTPEQWARTYGGAQVAYASILSEVDCASLERRFQILLGDYELLLDSERRSAIGMMTATRLRADALGCPNELPPLPEPYWD